MLITQLIVEEESSIDPQVYWVSFRSAMMTGQALFYPHGDIAAVRSPISVEVDQQEIRDFQVLAADVVHDYRIEALPDRGDYQIIGRVAITIETDADTTCAIGICADESTAAIHSWTFWLSSEESDIITVAKDDWVAFRLIGLSLWDTGI
jgi:hypothetical protein